MNALPDPSAVRADDRYWLLLFVVLASVYIALLGMTPFPLDFAIKSAPILLLLAVCGVELKSGIVRRCMLLALLFSAVGDVLLATAFPWSFAAGLGAFLCAQLVYLSLFWRYRRGYLRRWPLVLAVLAFYITMLVWLLPQTGALKLPVAVYMTAISGMVLAACLYQGSGWVLLGALSFMVSDTVIALNRFWQPFAIASMVIMITYYLAQLMIVWGVLQTERGRQQTRFSGIL